MDKFIPIYLRTNGRKVQIKRIMKNCDLEFWEDLYDEDLEEAIDEYVRDCVDLSEWID